jgi:hypothetical protein
LLTLLTDTLQRQLYQNNLFILELNFATFCIDRQNSDSEAAYGTTDTIALGGPYQATPQHSATGTPGPPPGPSAADDAPPPADDDSSTAGTTEKLGRIQFSLGYDFDQTTLTLRVIRAVELAPKDFTGTSDPYVKVMLLPDKKRKLVTKIRRRNLNPRGNDVFAFEGE